MLVCSKLSRSREYVGCRRAIVDRYLITSSNEWLVVLCFTHPSTLFMSFHCHSSPIHKSFGFLPVLCKEPTLFCPRSHRIEQNILIEWLSKRPSTLFHSCHGYSSRFNLRPGLKPFPKRQSLDFPKLKEFADDNFKFDENGTQFSNRVENTAGKGEIARYEQFFLFPQCFQKTCTADT